MDDCALLNVFLDRLHLLDGFLPSALHDLVDPTLTDMDTVQVRQSRFRAGIAHMLFCR